MKNKENTIWEKVFARRPDNVAPSANRSEFRAYVNAEAALGYCNVPAIFITY